jgi:GT2 family glycosyltransferase
MPDAEIAFIVTTYQQPGHLRLALESIACQRTKRRLEVVVADDGSLDDTPAVVAEYSRRVPFSVRLVTHPHAGFRPALCRNEGVRHTTAGHLLFFDGDCVLPPDHLEEHLAAWRPGVLTSGYCVRLDQEASRQIDIDAVRRGAMAAAASTEELSKLKSLHRKAWWYSAIGHPAKPALKSTDFSLSRTDFRRVNGFDEQFVGWGCEDDDLGRRLRAAGIRPVSVLDRTRVYHLWHPPAPSKPGHWQAGHNVAYLKRPIRLTRCLQGLVPREPRDLTVRLAGKAENAPALARLIDSHGWKLEIDPDRRADLELLALPGGGRFRGTGDCRVLVALDECARVPWRFPAAQVVLSPHGRLGRKDQIRLSLGDRRGFWRALSAAPLPSCGLAAAGRLAVLPSGV